MSNKPKRYQFSFCGYPDDFDINIDLSKYKLDKPISTPHISLGIEKIVKRKNKETGKYEKVALTNIYIHDELSTSLSTISVDNQKNN